MEDIVKDILDKKFIGENWVRKNYPDFHLFVFNLFDEDISWKGKFHLYTQNIKSVPKCFCGNLIKYEDGKFKEFCSKKCSSNSIHIKQKRKQTNIERYGATCPLNNKEVKKKAIDTLNRNYGVDNPSKSTEIKEKVKNTNIEKFGVEYVSQLATVKEILSSKMKSNRKSMSIGKNKSIEKSIINKLDNYEVDFLQILETSIYELNCRKCNCSFNIHKNNLNDRIYYNNTICTNCNPINNLYSDGETKLYEFIVENYDGIILRNDRTLIGKELDIYLPDLNLAFEFNGIYWHSDIYKPKSYHKDKTDSCLAKNVNLMHIWEDDWKNKNEIVKSNIMLLLGKSKKVETSSFDVTFIDYEKANIFLEKNHLMGKRNSDYYIGILKEDILYSVMAIVEDEEFRIVRIGNLLNTEIDGIKIMLDFLLKLKSLKLTLYIDRSWETNIHQTDDFIFSHHTKPNKIIKENYEIYDSGYSVYASKNI